MQREMKFLLTHPVWDVTTLCPLLRSSTMNFYSHIPCGMWPSPELYVVASETFLLTHPVWDVTLHPVCPYIAARYFYSHIPCGMWRPFPSIAIAPVVNFYSHIPCGMWPLGGNTGNISLYFYSHIPCGMWLAVNATTPYPITFLLTHPVWDVTSNDKCYHIC